MNYKKIISVSKILVLNIILAGLISACSTTHKSSQSLRTSIEQLLLSEAVSRSFSQKSNTPLPIPQGANIVVDTFGMSADQGYVKEVIVGWLGQQGYQVKDDKTLATHQINVIVESLGTELEDTFFGIPPISGSFIPISTPEMAFYKSQKQTGYVKLFLNIYELPSNQFVQTMRPFISQTYYDDYTVLFLFTFNKTDLTSPPDLGLFRKTKNLRPSTDSAD